MLKRVNSTITDFTGLGARCAHEVAPQNENELVEVVQFAQNYGRKIVPIGGLTGTSGGYKGKADIGIRFGNLNNIRDLGNGRILAQAGVTASKLNSYLSEQGQTVPMTEAPAATIGGCIAMNNPNKPYGSEGLEACVESIRVISPRYGLKEFSRNTDTADLLSETIGGEGLTGIVVSAVFRPIPIKPRFNISIKFDPNDFGFLESFWEKIKSETPLGVHIARGLVLPLGMLQVRAICENEQKAESFQGYVQQLIAGTKRAQLLEGAIPIGEPVIAQVRKVLGKKYQFFPAISNIGYQDQLVSSIIQDHCRQAESRIALIHELEIGDMPNRPNSTSPFNGRIPGYSLPNVWEGDLGRADLVLLNYGGSNVGGGTHIAFFSDELEIVEEHAATLFRKLFWAIPDANTLEHKASFIRAEQILYESGAETLESRRKIRRLLDPKQIISTAAMQSMDSFQSITSSMYKEAVC